MQKLQNSTLGKLLFSIEDDFNSWKEQGEFEKQAELKKRLQDSSVVVFKRICQYHIAEMEDIHGLEVRGEHYNADREVFTFEIWRNMGITDEGVGDKWELSCPN